MKLNKAIGASAVVGKKGQIEFSQVSKLKLLISCALCAISLQLIVTFAAGEHALSEVWSESEGLQLKYSTNHDDLLGAKGSEMSLSTQQHKHEAANPQAGGSQTTSGDSSPSSEAQEEANQQAGGAGQSDEAAESAPATPPAPEVVAAGGPSAGGGNQQANSEEDNDNDNDAPSGESSLSAGAESQTADSRPKTERVPIASRQYIGSGSRSSSNSASVKPHQQQQQQQYSQENSKSHFRPYDGPETSSRKAKVDQDDDAPPSFNSALEQAEGGDTANVDHGDDSESVRGDAETGAMRFRQPGKLFKQAVRMNEQQADDDSGDEGAAAKGGAERQQESNEEPAGAVPNGEPEFGPTSSLQERNGSQRQQQATSGSYKTRQNMIDFDRVVSSGRQTAAAEREAAGEQPDGRDDGFAPLPFGASQKRAQQQAGSEEADEDGGEFGGLFKAPQQPQNSFLLGHRSSGDRRAQMATSAGSNREARMQVSPRSPAGGQPPPPQQPFFSAAAKSLAYFKSQHPQHQQTGRARNSLLEVQMAIPAPAGPDSVRDNFISPGHFPGSMPHLTQAASEAKKKQIEPPASPEVAASAAYSGGGSKQAEVDNSSSASSSMALVEEAQGSSQSVAQSAAPAVLKEQPAGASDSAFVAAAAEVATSRVQPEQRQANLSRLAGGQPVTPEPEVQPESQQIMAPILLSTTTMAPLVATGGPTVSGSATATTSTASPTTTTTTTTSQAPYLHRFKFRKYR